jgi:hypothetical protein
LLIWFWKPRRGSSRRPHSVAAVLVPKVDVTPLQDRPKNTSTASQRPDQAPWWHRRRRLLGLLPGCSQGLPQSCRGNAQLVSKSAPKTSHDIHCGVAPLFSGAGPSVSSGLRLLLPPPWAVGQVPQPVSGAYRGTGTGPWHSVPLSSLCNPTLHQRT